MTNKSDSDIERIADLQIRKYFDHFMEEVLPTILTNHTLACPHGKNISRVKWSLIGGAIALAILVPAFGDRLLAALSAL